MSLLKSKLGLKFLMLSLLLQAIPNVVAKEKAHQLTKPLVTQHAMASTKQQMAAHTDALRHLMNTSMSLVKAHRWVHAR
jgi:hypothetical protein